MASILLNNLKNQQKTSEKTNVTFIDLHLDIVEGDVKTQDASSSVLHRDIRVDTDERAIRNSLLNIFNTIKGERILLPTFGSDLRQYLFMPVTDTIGRQIGRDILSSIRKWEPRVEVKNIFVNGFPERQEYEVEMILGIPFLNKDTSLALIISEEGFIESKV